MGDTATDSYYNSTSDWTTTKAYEKSHNNETSVLQQVRSSMVVASLVIYSLTCVLGIPGNALVIWIAGMTMKKTVNTIWYVNLAVADLICCGAIPFFLAFSVLEYWPYGAAMCKILPAVLFVTMYASVFTLTLISLDRFSLVIWPIWAQNHRSISRAWQLCGLAWFLALLLSLPKMIYTEFNVVNNETTCHHPQSEQYARRAIRITRAVFGFIVPLLVITVCSLLIARRVRVGHFKSQKALCIMVGVVTAFVVCWLPYHTVALVKGYGADGPAKVAGALYPLAWALAYFNSCLNPMLYVFMGQDFKERVRVSMRHIFENAFREDATPSAVTNTSEAQVLDKV